jgi:hypothetical protein
MLNAFSTKDNESNSSPDYNSEFHRKIYFQCVNFIEKSNKNICLLTGPRKIGKTYCLNQIVKDYNAVYFDMKQYVDNEDKVNEVFDIIKEGSSKLVVIDEVTYVNCTETFFNSLASIFSGQKNNPVKVIITGSQSYALRRYSSIGLNAVSISSSFIDFEEWLLYRGKIANYGDTYNVTEADYLDYITNVKEFTKIESNEEYLLACIDESIESEHRSVYSIDGLADVRTEDVHDIIALAYSTLISLHNKSSYENVIDFSGAIKSVRLFFNQVNGETKIKSTDYERAVEHSVVSRIKRLGGLKLDDLHRYLKFLVQCDFMLITETSDEVKTTDVYKWIVNDRDIGIKSPADFFRKYIITFKYPLFFYNIIDDISSYIDGVTGSDLLASSILGSIVECHVRSLLSYRYNRENGIEFRDRIKNGEVDYVNYCDGIMVEISIRNKSNNDLWLDLVPDSNEYKKTVLSKDWDNELYTPYYKYILELSRGIFINEL